MGFIKKNSIYIHRLFCGFTGAVVDILAPVYIYSASGDIFYALIFLLAKYVLSSLFLLAFKNSIDKNPVLFVAVHILILLSANLSLLFLQTNLAAVLLAAVLFAAAEIFYAAALNVIFAVRTQNNLASVLQIPFSAGLLAAGVILRGFSVSPDFAFFAVAAVFVLQVFSLLPLALDNQIKIQNRLCLARESPLPCKNPKRDLFHVFWGITEAASSELLPLYLIFTQSGFELTLAFFAFAEAARLLLAAAGKGLYLKGFFNFAVLLSALLFTASFVSVWFAKGGFAFAFAAAAAASLSLGFVPKYSAYVGAIKRENKIHFNQSRRELLSALSKLALPLVCMAFRSFLPVLVLGAVSGMGMLAASYNYGASADSSLTAE